MFINCPNAPKTNRTRTRSASLSVELLVLLPIILGVVLAGIELSLLVSVQQQLAAASAQGARVAAQGGSETEVEEAVLRIFGDGPLSQATVKTNLNENPQSGDPVVVLVEVQADQVVPDLFAIVGFSIQGDLLVGRTVLRKE